MEIIRSVFIGICLLALGYGSASAQHPSQITTWKSRLEASASEIFGPGGGTPVTPAVDVKSLHAKIGGLTLENDFLEGALTKAGWLSAKR
jgi:transposase